ncbi:hypothetical protein SAMN05661086_00728 [Anaeromicropila populeti]|uniref:Zinc-finger n=2 Tax=Anaeromicropila populeti TaxID=37658 RepID=A0A1I6IEI4_9FIRM|nr:hypothetical protein SAMN05661086_00728 [Anaeromicropila populeti]
MPAYIENLTSTNTSQDIQEHLKECDGCKKLYNDLKEEISFEKTAEKNRRKQEKNDLMYLGKIRKSQDKKAVISLAVFVCITVLLLKIIWNYNKNMDRSIYLSYGILTLAILTGGLLCYKNFEAVKKVKYDLWAGQGIVGIAAITNIFITYRTFSWTASQVYPFNLQAYEMGPFVAKFLCAGISIGAIVFFYGAVCIIKKSYAYYFLCGHAVSLVCMDIGLYRILKTLTSIEDYRRLCFLIGGIYLLGSGMTVILWSALKNYWLKKVDKQE